MNLKRLNPLGPAFVVLVKKDNLKKKRVRQASKKNRKRQAHNITVFKHTRQQTETNSFMDLQEMKI